MSPIHPKHALLAWQGIICQCTELDIKCEAKYTSIMLFLITIFSLYIFASALLFIALFCYASRYGCTNIRHTRQIYSLHSSCTPKPNWLCSIHTFNLALVYTKQAASTQHWRKMLIHISVQELTVQNIPANLGLLQKQHVWWQDKKHHYKVHSEWHKCP
jgi:hypothetical protein